MNDIMIASYYERCRALINVICDQSIDRNDKDALLAILEDEYASLGEFIEKSQMK